MRRFIGPLLLTIGVLDLLLVFLEFTPQFAAIARDGVWNAVQWPGMRARLFDRETAFWHLAAGIAMTLLGGLAHWGLSVTGTLPRLFGWALLLFAALGVILMPVSGFWAIFVPAVLILRLPRGAAQARSAHDKEALWLGRAPSPRLEALLASTDYLDVTTTESAATLRSFVAAALSWRAPWLKTLIRFVHSADLPPDALSAEALSFRPGDEIRLFTVVEAAEERYLLLEAANKHLSAYLVFLAGEEGEGRRTFNVVTLVHYNCWTGPLYFSAIRPGHLLVLGSMVRAGARA